MPISMRFLRPSRRAQTLQRLKQVTKKNAATKLQKAFRKNQTLKQTLNKMRKTYKSVDRIPSLIDQKLNQVSQATYKQDFNQPEIADQITGQLYKGEALLAILIEQLRKAPSLDAALLMVKSDDTRTLINTLPVAKRGRIYILLNNLEVARYQLHRRAIKLKYARIWVAMSPKERAAARKKAKKKLKDELDKESFPSRWSNRLQSRLAGRLGHLEWLLVASKVGPTDIEAKKELSRQEKLMVSDMEHAARLPAILADKLEAVNKKYGYLNPEQYDSESGDEDHYEGNDDWHDNYINWGSLINYKGEFNDPRYPEQYYDIPGLISGMSDSDPVRREWNGILCIYQPWWPSWAEGGKDNVNVTVKVNDINSEDIVNGRLSTIDNLQIRSASILYIKLDFMNGYSGIGVWRPFGNKRPQYKKGIGFYEVDGITLEGRESGFYKYDLSRIPSNISELNYEVVIKEPKP